ncbi:hypothetical protein BGZ76_001079 [Entomortierella beljakovae]|nr:hypothetical protein BGZ76_001079 [Entomortierella beljakovae]
MPSHISKKTTQVTTNTYFMPFQTQEQILTAPELRSMDQHDFYNPTGSFSTGVVLPSTEDFSYLQRDAFNVPQQQFHPIHFRHSFQGTPIHHDGDDAKIIMFANDMIDSSIELSASARGAPMNYRRRTQSLQANPTVPSMTMNEAFTCGYYGEPHSVSLPASPSASSLESSPVQPTPEFLPSSVVDVPYFSAAVSLSLNSYTNPSGSLPTILPFTENDHVHSTSPSPILPSTLTAAAPLQPSPFHSPVICGGSACNSPSLSPSPKMNRKRRLSNSIASLAEFPSDEEPVAKKRAAVASGNAKKPKHRYVCPIEDCSRTFSRPYNLKSHGLTHATQRPFQCGKCTKSFARIHDRDRHMNSHMPQKPHLCIVCLGRFARQDAVIRHLKLSNETNACAWILKNKVSKCLLNIAEKCPDVLLINK